MRCPGRVSVIRHDPVTQTEVTISMKKLHLTLVSAFVIGMLAAAVVVFAFDGPFDLRSGPSISAATDTATPRDLSPPVLTSSTVSGTELELTYNEPLDSSSVPLEDQYTLSVSPRPGTPVTVSNVSISAAVEDIHTVRLTYLAPTALRETPQGPNRIDLVWTAPANEGGAALSGYRIEVSTDGNSWSDLVADTSSTGTTHSHTGLELGDRRHYRVSAINRGGTSQPSNVALPRRTAGHT